MNGMNTPDTSIGQMPLGHILSICVVHTIGEPEA